MSELPDNIEIKYGKLEVIEKIPIPFFPHRRMPKVELEIKENLNEIINRINILISLKNSELE